MSRNLSRVGDTHSYNTKNANNFAFHIYSISLSEEKSTYMGSKVYNLLAGHFKDIIEERLFKTKTERWLLGQLFYSVGEFINWNT